MAQRNTSTEYTGPSVNEMVRNHTLAKEIIARHDDPCPILDDPGIAQLRNWVRDPTDERHRPSVDNEPGNLVAHIASYYGTAKSLIIEEELEALRAWFAGGGGKTGEERVTEGKK